MFIAEPVQGAGGVIVPQDDYFPRIREICDQYEVLLVADEVITGFGRTGKWFGLEHWGVQPDVVQFAKAITSGYFPLGGIGVSDEIAAVLEAARHALDARLHLQRAPGWLRRGVAQHRHHRRGGLPAQAAEKGAYLLKGLQAELGDHPHVGDVRGMGLMCGVEIVKDKATKEEFAARERSASRCTTRRSTAGCSAACAGTSIAGAADGDHLRATRPHRRGSAGLGESRAGVLRGLRRRAVPGRALETNDPAEEPRPAAQSRGRKPALRRGARRRALSTSGCRDSLANERGLTPGALSGDSGLLSQGGNALPAAALVRRPYSCKRKTNSRLGASSGSSHSLPS